MVEYIKRSSDIFKSISAFITKFIALINVVLLKEIQLLEIYLDTIWKTIKELKQKKNYLDIQEDPEIFLTYQCLVKNLIPMEWMYSGHIVPFHLDKWTLWLLNSITFFQNWLHFGIPESIWLAAFCNPSGIYIYIYIYILKI